MIRAQGKAAVLNRTMLLSAIVGMTAISAAAADKSGKAEPNRPSLENRCAKVEAAEGTPAVPGGDIFGFTSPTDIGDPCSFGLSLELTGLAGKRDGRYASVTDKTQFSYTYSDRIAFAFSAFATHTRWREVSVAQDALLGAGDGVFLTSVNRLDFDGLSGEVLINAVARSPGQPFAVTLAAEPRWSRVDSLTGYRAEGYGSEFKLFADVALTERLFAAMNLTYGLSRSRYDIANADWDDASATSASVALTLQLHAAEKQPVEGIFIGAEARVLSEFEGLALNRNVGNALFAGPTLAVAFKDGRMLNAVWTPQVAGRARPPSAPGALDLDNFQRHQFRVKFSTPIGG